jgi:hypothetical protein
MNGFAKYSSTWGFQSNKEVSLAKKKTLDKACDEIENKPLQKFLLHLTVKKNLRDKYTSASDEEKKTLLREEFEIGEPTITALVDEPTTGKVKARFGVNDQQGFRSVKRSKKR